MKNLFLFFILLIFTNCSKDPKKENWEVVNIDINVIKSDTIKEQNYIAIFDDKTGKKSTLTKSETKIVKINLEKAVSKYNEELKIKLANWNKDAKKPKWNYEKEKINLRNYFRQYIISIDKNGDKIVRVFCFCSRNGEFWRNEIMSVNDGGDCYLNAKINITKDSTEYFGTNGSA